MILTYLGGIGSGKTISIIREIVKNSYSKAFTNFNLKNVKYHRLKLPDIIMEYTETIDKRKYKKRGVNWGFWKKERQKNPYFCIYLDEIHNLINSRRSMSGTNIIMSKWVSQVRKILNDNPFNHLYLISQTLSKIDKDFRDLGHIFVDCSAKMLGERLIIINSYYEGISNYSNNIRHSRSWFYADVYYKYYDHTEMIDFGDVEEYV